MMTPFLLRPKGRINPVLTLLCIIGLICLFTVQATANDGSSPHEDRDLFKILEAPEETDGNASDLFREIETDEPPAPPVGDVRKLWRQILGNQESSLRLKAGFFFDKQENRADPDNAKYVSESLLRFSTWIGSRDLKFNLAGWFEYGTQDDTYQGIGRWFQDNEDHRRMFDINELYGVWSLDAMDITAGKKEITTGMSTLYSPSDRFRPTDLNDPMDPRQLGLWQVRSDYYLENSKIELIFIPIYTYKKFPAPGSPWWGSSDIPEFGDDMPNISWEYMDLFAKYKTTLNGWDLFASVNSGPNPYIVIRQQGVTAFQTVNRIFTLSTGFSTTWGKFEIHGESLYNHSHKGRDDDYLASVVGFTYTIDDKAEYLFMEQVVFTLEYAGELILDRQDADGYIRSSRDVRAGVNEMLSRLTFKVNEDLTVKNDTHLRLSDQSWMNRLEARYRFSGGLSLTCALEIFEDEQSDRQEIQYFSFEEIGYGQWDKNDRVIVMLTYDF